MPLSIPSGARVLSLAGVATATLSGGAMAAVAPGPVALPAEVIGVVGSGDKLSLRIKAGDETRLLNIGDIYQDGWALTALTNTTATLTRNGQSQTVGLNPAGLVAQARADGPATTVRVVGATDLVELQARQVALRQLLKEQLGAWDGTTPRLGLTLEETQRYVAYRARGVQAEARQDQLGRSGFLTTNQVSSLGDDRMDYLVLNQKLLLALRDGSGLPSIPWGFSTARAGPSADPPTRPLLSPTSPVVDSLQASQDLQTAGLTAAITVPAEDLFASRVGLTSDGGMIVEQSSFLRNLAADSQLRWPGAGR
ncbi:MAG: hypothetical protein JWM33_923 [Caulobacteraceae bacterium]|nr:hypothetical protein [Caulobacteraceae bacterium]